MIQTTYSGTSVLLVDNVPNWSRKMDAALDVPTVTEDALTLREQRRQLGAKLRVSSFKFSILMNSSEGDAFRAMQLAYDTRPVLCPFWPAVEKANAFGSASITGKLRLWFESDFSKWEITYNLSAPTGFTIGANTLTVPVMWGRFAKTPEIEAINSKLSEADVSFVETGSPDFALAAKAVTLSTGSGARPILGVTPDWRKQVGGTEIRVDRERIGNIREEVETYATHTARRTQEIGLVMFRSSEVAQLVRMFEVVGGNVGAWWCPVAGKTAGTLLCRFKTASLKVSWKSPAIAGKERAEASLSIVELPTESSVPSDETAGATIGALPPPWWGFRFTRQDNTVFLYTSYESDTTITGIGTFKHAPIERGDIVREVNLKRNDMSISIGSFPGSPFEVLRYDLTVSFKVEVFEGVVGVDSAAVIFTGDLLRPSFDGSVMTGKVAGMDSLFDMKGPLALTSKRCGAALYSAICGLPKASKAAPAELKTIMPDGTVVFGMSGNFSTDYFRFGYAENAARGIRLQIAGNGAASGTAVALTTGLYDWWDFTEAANTNRVGAKGKVLSQAGNVQIATSKRRTNGVFLNGGVDPNYLIGPSDMAPTTGYTYSGWFCQTSDIGSAWYGLFQVNRASGQVGRSNASRYSSNIVATVHNGTMWMDSDHVPGSSLNQWVHVTVVVTGTYMSMYINGTKYHTDYNAVYGEWYTPNIDDDGYYQPPEPELVTDVSFSMSGITDMTAKLGYQGVANNFAGNIDQFAVWNRPLSDAEAYALYNSGSRLIYSEAAALSTSNAMSAKVVGSVPAASAYPESGWVLVPGCSKSWENCIAHGNSANFRGFPRFPKSNPALVAIKQSTSSGAKK